MQLTRDRKTELLAATPLFEGLEPEELGRIVDRTVETDYGAGGVIVREGEIGTGFFIVVDGRVKVVRSGTTVAHLGPGEFFGELSVLDGGPRVAQVVAEAPTTCLAIASWDFERVLRDEPGVALAVLRVVAARLRTVTTDHRT